MSEMDKKISDATPTPEHVEGDVLSVGEMERLREAYARWYAEFSKAFITQVSEGGEVGQPSTDRYIKVAFKTLDDLHDAYMAMAALADPAIKETIDALVNAPSAIPSSPAGDGELVEAVMRIRATAMLWTLRAQIPEAGLFGAIAQDADWLCDNLPARLSQGTGVRVKALEWKSDHHNQEYASGYVVLKHPCATDYWCLDIFGRRQDEDYPSAEVAKAAAQADYETRIRAALSGDTL